MNTRRTFHTFFLSTTLLYAPISAKAGFLPTLAKGLLAFFLVHTQPTALTQPTIEFSSLLQVQPPIFVLEINDDDPYKLFTMSCGHSYCCTLFRDNLSCAGENVYGATSLQNNITNLADVEDYQDTMIINYPPLKLDEDLTTKRHKMIDAWCGPILCYGALDDHRIKYWDKKYHAQLRLDDIENRGNSPHTISKKLPFIYLKPREVDFDNLIIEQTCSEDYCCAKKKNDEFKCWEKDEEEQPAIETDIKIADEYTSTTPHEIDDQLPVDSPRYSSLPTLPPLPTLDYSSQEPLPRPLEYASTPKPYHTSPDAIKPPSSLKVSDGPIHAILVLGIIINLSILLLCFYKVGKMIIYLYRNI